MSLDTLFKGIQDTLRQDPGLNGEAERLGQLAWMLFLKVFDDREAERELLDESYRSPLPEPYRWRRWARESKLSGNALIRFVNDDLLTALRQLPVSGENARIVGVLRGTFAGARNAMNSGTRMRQVLDALDTLDFNKASDRHQLDDLYEQLLLTFEGSRRDVAHHVPRALTRFIVDRVDPKLGDKVLDPACGTGSFLVSALEHVRTRYVRKPEDEERLQQDLWGVESDPLIYLLCVTHLLIHDLPVPPRIRRDESPARPHSDGGPSERFQVLLTHPRWRDLQDNLKLLDEEGRAAVVLTDDILSGEGTRKSLRQELLEEYDLHTIVRLPRGVFAPYAGTKTNVLFLTQGRPTTEVWFYEHPCPHGDKGYSPGRPLRFEEFDPERHWWNQRQENAQAWKVRIEDLRARDFDLTMAHPRHASPSSAPRPSRPSAQEPLFSWVHLSDIHMGHGGAGHQWDQKLVLNALQRDIREQTRRPGLPRPDAILVTGDIAFSGAPTQYSDAREWLRAVAREVGLDERQVFTVPGNHDVQRAADKHPNLRRMMRALRDGTDDFDESLKNETDRAQLAQRMEEYLKFASGFAPACLSPPGSASQDLFWLHPLEARGGLKLRLVGLNTALLCADNADKGKLRLGKEALGRVFGQTQQGNELDLVLSHHPFRDQWLADQRDIESWLRTRVHIHLSGHVHQAELEESRSGSASGALLRVVAGAVHGERQPADVPAGHGYNLAALYSSAGGSLVLRVWPRLWSEPNKDFRLDVHSVPQNSEFAERPLTLDLSGKR